MPCSVYTSFIYNDPQRWSMAKSTTIAVNKELHATRIDDVLKDFQQESQSMDRQWLRFWQFPKIKVIHILLKSTKPTRVEIR